MSEEVTEHDMPQKEACKLMNISGGTMKKLRDRHLATDDWYYVREKGQKPKIMIRPTGIAKLRVHYAAAEVLPLMVPRFCQAKVIRFATNPKNRDGEDSASHWRMDQRPCICDRETQKKFASGQTIPRADH